MAETKTKLTWHRLCCLEPALGHLLRDIQINVKRIAKNNPRFDADSCWYGEYKPQLTRLVGFASVHKNDEILSSSEAYDLAYKKLYSAMPGK